jgi:thymidylate synthase ThyX
MELPFEPYILKYSTSYVNNPLMSVLVPIPTVKLAELRTHRLFTQLDITLNTNDKKLSINANSSRAIPINKQIESTLKNTFTPIWTRNKKGMQGDIITNQSIINELNDKWKCLLAGSYTDSDIEEFMKFLDSFNIHKQDASLILNPFSWTTCIITGDKEAWENFFELRCPKYQHESGKEYKSKREYIDFYPDSNLSETEWNSINKSMTYPAIQVIAEKLYDLYKYNKPEQLEPGDWHIVFDDPNLSLNERLALSISKCALISYDNQNLNQDLQTHLDRANKLINSKHYSTAEHQYKVPTKEELLSDDFKEYYTYKEGIYYYHRGKYVSNIKGWIQYRKLLE